MLGVMREWWCIGSRPAGNQMWKKRPYWCLMCIKLRWLRALNQLCNTTPVYVPPGCTSLVQPLEVVNAPFKWKIETCAMQHVQDNLEQYLNGKFTASERRVLLTGWIGQAWEDISSNKEMIVRSFKKCGISVAADGSEDSEIHIEGLESWLKLILVLKKILFSQTLSWSGLVSY